MACSERRRNVLGCTNTSVGIEVGVGGAVAEVGVTEEVGAKASGCCVGDELEGGGRESQQRCANVGNG